MLNSLSSIYLKEPTKENLLISFGLGIFWLGALLFWLNFFPYSSLVFLLFLIILTILIFRFPETGIHLIIIFLMVFERWFGLESVNFFGVTLKIYPLDIVIILTILAVIFQKNFHWPRLPKKVVYPLITFFLVIIIWSGLSIFNGGNQALIGSALKNFIFYPAIIFWLILFYCQTEKQWLRIYKIFLISGAILIFFITLGIFFGQGIWSEYTPLSTAGVRLLAATHAFYLLLPLYLLICLICFQKKFFGKVDLIILFIWLVGLIVSLFRNLWIGFLIGLGIIFSLLKNIQQVKFVNVFLKILILVIICLIMVVWLSYLITSDRTFLDPYLTSLKERVQALNPFTMIDESAKFRLAAWKEARELLLQKPLIGIGFGQSLQFQLANSDYEIDVREIHNDYLAFLLQLGFIGFSFFLLLIFSIIQQSYKIVKKAEIKSKPYLIASFTFLITFLILSALGTYWETNLFIVFFWLNYGLIISAKEFSKTIDN